MAANDEEVAVLLWQFIFAGEDEKTRLWVHRINEKRDRENTLQCFIEELRCDVKKFRNFTRLSTTTFDYILDVISERLRRNDTNYRKSITPEQRLFVTLRYVLKTYIKTKHILKT